MRKTTENTKKGQLRVIFCFFFFVLTLKKLNYFWGVLSLISFSLFFLNIISSVGAEQLQHTLAK
jgi:hypothetical protein